MEGIEEKSRDQGSEMRQVRKRTEQIAIERICVIGFPSKLGGADTELDHQITCWRRMGVEVHLIRTGPFDKNGLKMKESVEDRGCIVHKPRDWSRCEGMHVISYCNGGFLSNLQEIRRYAKTTTFVGCMTWAFDKEKRAHREGLIDLELFQTVHQQEKISRQLDKVSPEFRWAYTTPYWNSDPFPFIGPSGRKEDKFQFGRISRDDAAKYSRKQLWIYENMTAPVAKEGLILGFGGRTRRKVGNPPSWIRALRCGAVSQQEFYRFASCIIQASDTTENLPRIGFEALSSGSVLIVDDRGGWSELVKHGETGFLCKNNREFVQHSTRMAFETKERKRIARNARDWLDTNWNFESSKKSWEDIFHILASI
ncbi:MAG: glycosyltransferase family 4 protein [Proteobacteria bacterium]|nr:glycosyltransferase family 4 protein [Pseudomonadota bacterium]